MPLTSAENKEEPNDLEASEPQQENKVEKEPEPQPPQPEPQQSRLAWLFSGWKKSNAKID